MRLEAPETTPAVEAPKKMAPRIAKEIPRVASAPVHGNQAERTQAAGSLPQATSGNKTKAGAAEGALQFDFAGDPYQAQEQFESILAVKDPSLRAQSLSNLLLFITPENSEMYFTGWMQVSQAFRSFPEENTRANYNWGKLKGPEVVGVRTGTRPADIGGRNGFVKAQFQGWISADPAAAKAWMDGLGESEFRTAMQTHWDAATGGVK